MKYLLLILFTGLTLAVSAQEAEVDVDSTYFHPAASLYVSGDSTTASNLVVKGLAEFPNNGKLLRLKELIDQEQQKDQDQQNEDQKQDQQDQENQDQQDPQDQDPQDQDQQDQENQDQQDQENPEQQNEDQQDQEQQPPPSAEQMSEDEAQRLLDAMKQEEETKRLQLHPVMGSPVKVDKDW